MSAMNMDGTQSTDKLFSKGNRSSKLRILTGLVGLLVLAVVGLVVALVVVSSDKSNNNTNDSQTGGQQGGQTGGQTGCSIPSCPLNPNSDTPELDKANCILDSYPLVDG